MSLPMTKATYRARACGAASFAMSSKGNQQIALPFEITQGEFAGHNLTWLGTFHDTADKNGTTGTERVLESLMFTGWQGDDPTELMEIGDEQAKQMMPDEVDLVCEPDTYDGKTTLKVKWVNKPGAGRFAFKEPATKADLKSFAAQMKAMVRGMRGANGAKPRNTQPHPNAPGNDGGDIPF